MLVSLHDRVRGVPFAKALADDLDRLEALLSRQETAIRRAFAEFVRSATSDRTVREVIGFIERGEIENAVRVADGYISRMGAVIPQIFNAAGQAETAAMVPKFLSFAPTIGISFDPSDHEAADLARRARLRFIAEFTDRQREATRNALTDSFLTGRGSVATARSFRESIGLTEYQRGVVNNYRTALEGGSRDALDRELRDRRFDRTVARSIKTGDPLSQEQIDRMVAAYQKRYLQYRAEVIARTEAVRITSQARRVAFIQNLHQVGLTEADAEHTWHSVRDNRTRETHRDMNGQKQPFSRPFQSPSGAQLMYPGDPNAPADEVCNCRCSCSYQLKPLARAA